MNELLPRAAIEAQKHFSGKFISGWQGFSIEALPNVANFIPGTVLFVVYLPIIGDAVVHRASRSFLSESGLIGNAERGPQNEQWF